MNFCFSDEQQNLIEAAHSIFAGEVTPARLRMMARGDAVPNLWPQFSTLGLLGVMAPETANGLEQNLAVMAAIAEKAGSVCLPEPLIEQAGIVVPLLVECDAPDILAQLLAGSARIGVASPLRPYIAHLADYTHIILHEAGVQKIIPLEEVEYIPCQSVDPLRPIFKLTNMGEGFTTALENGAILSSAQLCGLAQSMLDMAVDYAQTRTQFGQAIGSFQAIKHLLANVHTQIEFTRPLIWHAGLKRGAVIHMAKIAAIDTAMHAAETAIQVFGGMGYTYEADLHFFMKRVWALCGEWGDRNYHISALAEAVLSADPLPAPETLFAL